MRNLKTLIVTGLLALTGTWVSAKTTFTLSTHDPDHSEITLSAKKFEELVAAKTGGEA